MKSSKTRIHSDIFFGISLILIIFTFFFDTNYLFTIAYSPMSPAFIGGKTFHTAIYLVAAAITFISLCLKKRTAVYVSLTAIAALEIFNLLSPAVNYGERYLSSLFDVSGNLTVTVKTVIFVVIAILAVLIFSVKNRAVKTVLRILTVILPIAFLLYEYTTLKALDPNDVINLTAKAESSLVFDFLRFSTVGVYSFIPKVK